MELEEFIENALRRKYLEEMIAQLDEIGKDLKEARKRLSDMNWNTSPQNLLNWVDKGAMQLTKLIPAFKQIALQGGANMNVDEIWLRYHAYNKKCKTYIWCLVNCKACIATSESCLKI